MMDAAGRAQLLFGMLLGMGIGGFLYLCVSASTCGACYVDPCVHPPGLKLLYKVNSSLCFAGVSTGMPGMWGAESTLLEEFGAKEVYEEAIIDGMYEQVRVKPNKALHRSARFLFTTAVLFSIALMFLAPLYFVSRDVYEDEEAAAEDAAAAVGATLRSRAAAAASGGRNRHISAYNPIRGPTGARAATTSASTSAAPPAHAAHEERQQHADRGASLGGRDNAGCEPIPDDDYVKQYQRDPALWPVEFFIIVYRRGARGAEAPCGGPRTVRASGASAAAARDALGAVLQRAAARLRAVRRQPTRNFRSSVRGRSYDKIDVRADAFDGEDPELREFARWIRRGLRARAGNRYAPLHALVPVEFVESARLRHVSADARSAAAAVRDGRGAARGDGEPRGPHGGSGRDPRRRARPRLRISTPNVSNTILGVYMTLDATGLRFVDDRVPAFDLFGTAEVEREWVSLEDLKVLKGGVISAEDPKPTFISGFVVRQLVEDGVIDVRGDCDA
ncbi:hypothetical protein JL720_6243 [Aureococcus anophagefferens]|nr:hypothetical protein JL720_6243 [Aureococcus anophagefferens]